MALANYRRAYRLQSRSMFWLPFLRGIYKTDVISYSEFCGSRSYTNQFHNI